MKRKVRKKVGEKQVDDNKVQAILTEFNWIIENAISRQVQLRGKYVVYPYLDDLKSEGALALLESWGRFDPSRGILFSTFTFRRVSGRINNYLDKFVAMETTRYGSINFNNQIDLEGEDIKIDGGGFESDKGLSGYHLKLSHKQPLINNGDKLYGIDRYVYFNEIINQSLEFLSNADKKMLRKVYGLGKEKAISLSEFADNEGLTFKKVSSLKIKALRKLRKKIKKYVDSDLIDELLGY